MEWTLSRQRLWSEFSLFVFYLTASCSCNLRRATLLSFRNTSFIFHLLVLPSWGKHAWVQLWVQLECKWINTSDLIQTHTHKHITHTGPWYLPGFAHTYKLVYAYSIWRYTICTTTYLHMGSQINTLTHIWVLGGDTCVSACSHCCPLGCAVLHTVLTARLPSETKHLWTSILQEWYTADAEDIPLGTQRCVLCDVLTFLYLFDSKDVMVPTFLYSWPYLLNALMNCQ